ncbi:MAG: DUF3617 domain-containing protein [Gammaproteobacteria bacterium]
MKTLTLLALLAMGAVPLAAHAGSDLSRISTMKNPGEYQMTITRTLTVPGTKMSIPPKTLTKKECVTQKDIDDLINLKPKTSNGMTCKMVKRNLSGKTFTFVVDCNGKRGNLQVNGTTVFDSKDASHSHIESTGKAHNMPINATVDIKSKRIGECTASSSSQSGN